MMSEGAETSNKETSASSRPESVKAHEPRISPLSNLDLDSLRANIEADLQALSLSEFKQDMLSVVQTCLQTKKKKKNQKMQRMLRKLKKKHQKPDSYDHSSMTTP